MFSTKLFFSFVNGRVYMTIYLYIHKYCTGVACAKLCRIVSLYTTAVLIYTYNINILYIIGRCRGTFYFIYFFCFTFICGLCAHIIAIVRVCVKNIINNTTTSTTMTVGRHGRSSKIKEHERRATRPHDDPDDHISCTYV